MSLFGKQQNNKAPDFQAREQALQDKLRAIDLADPHRALSDEKILSLRLHAVIQDAIEQLHFPQTDDPNLSYLDNDLVSIISLLGESVKYGYELTAQWACTALTRAIRNLSIDMTGMDAEYADETMRCRREYSENLKLLVELCREHDQLSASLESRQQHRQEKRRELDMAKQRYQFRRDSGQLNEPLDNLKLHIHNPAALSDEARDLRDELSALHRLKSTIIELDVSIDADKLSLNNCAAQIDTRRNALAKTPRSTDPKLQQRINEADRLYREQLNKDLNEAEKAIRLYAEHNAAMTEFAEHSANLTLAARAEEERRQMEMERLRQKLSESQS